MTIQITYDSKTINLTVGEEGLREKYVQERNQARSGSGLIQTINQYGIKEMSFHAFFDSDIYEDLVAWWSWARQGKTWALAMDSTLTGSTTLDNGATAAQKSIPLTATAAFTAGDKAFLSNAADDSFEIVEIDAITNGVSVSAVADLKQSYISGDFFVHKNYFPKVVSLDSNFDPPSAGGEYSHTFKFADQNK